MFPNLLCLWSLFIYLFIYYCFIYSASNSQSQMVISEQWNTKKAVPLHATEALGGEEV
jgi:hypothetical protein